jgi:hypothetical protein
LEKEVMRTKNMKIVAARLTLARMFVFVVLLLLAFGDARLSLAQELGTKKFSSPGEACSALVDAVQKDDEQALESILGAGKEVSSSGDEVKDRLDRERFTQKYQEMHRLVREDGGSTVLYIGAENWPFPIPLASSQGVWYFDSRAGMREIRFRQVGENEATAIRVCNAFVMAGKQEKTTGTGGDPISQYAQDLFTTGKTNAGNRTDRDREAYLFHGYYFHIVTRNSPIGTNRDISSSKKTGSLILVASPAEYRASGIATFVVTQDGVVHEKDLGPDTERRVPHVEKHNNLDSTWQATD